MKAYIIQPYYSMDYSDLDNCIYKELSLMDLCDDSADIIVLPEYSDVLSVTPDGDTFISAIERYAPIIEEKVREMAKRCHAIVFANYGCKTDNGYRNTTHIFDREGNEIGQYFKQHPAPSEIKNPGIDTDYAKKKQDVYTIDIEGIRFCFRTCYDFYFYEDIIEIARKKPDIIIGCSYQRTDTHEALEIMNRFLSYNTNSYLLRSSISLGDDSKVCGCSMAVSPDGTILMNMKNRAGVEVVDFDEKKKYFKVAGFNGSPQAHYEYVDEGRRQYHEII